MEKQRTKKQNSAMHQYFKDIATALNESGLEVKVVLKPEVEIWWTPELAKNYLWRPIQKVMFDKKSTTELTTSEVSQVEKVMHRHLAQKVGPIANIPNFPSVDNMIWGND